MYKANLRRLGGYISQNGTVNLSRLGVLLSELGTVEEQVKKTDGLKKDFGAALEKDPKAGTVVGVGRAIVAGCQ